MYSVIILLSLVLCVVVLCSQECSCVPRSLKSVISSQNVEETVSDNLTSITNTQSLLMKSGMINSNTNMKPPENSEEKEMDLFEMEKIQFNRARTFLEVPLRDHMNYVNIPKCPNAYQFMIETTNDNSQRVRTKRRRHVEKMGNKDWTLPNGHYRLCSDRNGQRIRLQACGSKTRHHQQRGICQVQAQYKISKVGIFRQLSPSKFLQPSSWYKEEGEKLDKSGHSDCQPTTTCSLNQLVGRNLKNSMDCESFYVCIVGQLFLLRCPLGHEFSEEFGFCMEKESANCKLKPACQ